MALSINRQDVASSDAFKSMISQSKTKNETGKTAKSEKSEQANQTKQGQSGSQKDVIDISEHDDQDEKDSSSSFNFSAFKDNFSEETSANDGLGHGIFATMSAAANTESPEPIVIKGTDGNDNVKLSQNEDGTLTVNYNGRDTSYSPEDAERLLFDMGKGNNNFVADDTVTYGFGIKAADGDNTIKGGKGNDRIELGNGNNKIDSGGGGDTIKAGNGDNTINAGNAVHPSMSFLGVMGANIEVGDGNNKIVGSDGLDRITAGNGNNEIQAGGGNDVIKAGHGKNTIMGGDGDDEITVGKGSNFINGGKGNDTIAAGEGEKPLLDRIKGFFTGENDAKNVIYGGDGDDKIKVKDGTNYIYGGDGRDYLEGGRGNDTIYGGRGNDVIYGLDGNDVLHGGDGDDYIDGGKGNDKIHGGAGNDVIFGGKGNDTITDMSGKNAIADDGTIQNIRTAEGGENKIYQYDSNINSRLGQSIRINGDDDFKMRVESDMEALRAIPEGRQMLEEIEKTGKTVQIERFEQLNGQADPENFDDAVANADGTANVGTNVTVRYNPDYHTSSGSMKEKTPLAVLYHEFAHAYNMASGTLQPDKDASYPHTRPCENQAVGLEIPEGLEINYPDGTSSVGNPSALTENGLREALGLPLREIY